MKNKDFSKWIKFALIILGFGLSVLKWLGILGNATIAEIWQVIAFAYGIGLGTMDLNIIVDNLMEKKNGGQNDE